MFGKDHLPYAILAISVLLFVILLPLVVVLLYPLRTTQRCLNRCRLNSLAFRTFTDAFQGSFKDGTNGTRDCRYFAVVYQLPRMLGFFIYSLTLNGYFYFPMALVYLQFLLSSLPPYSHTRRMSTTRLIQSCSLYMHCFVLPFLHVRISIIIHCSYLLITVYQSYLQYYRSCTVRVWCFAGCTLTLHGYGTEAWSIAEGEGCSLR